MHDTPNVKTEPPADSPALLLLQTVDACASAYGPRVSWLVDIAAMRAAHHELRMLPVASYGVAA